MLDGAQHPSSTPLTLREPAPARTGADITDVHGVDRAAHAGFQEFVDQHRHLMSDYIARRMRGTPELCAEDALQDALIRMWQQWRHWPQDPERREVYMRQALKVAAVDAIRARYGRNLNRPREYPVNFADLDRCVPAEPGAQAIVRELGHAIARESLERQADKRDIERSVLVGAFAALTDLERRVLFMTARGDNGAQIAQELGVRHQLVRETLMRSRRLVRSLIEHADAGKVSPEEARRLWNLRDGNLSGRPRREAQRHLDHCTTCRRLAGIEDAVSEAGVRVFLPLPMATVLAAKTLAGTGAAGGSASAAASGPAGALAATGAGLLSGATAKAAVALGVIALGGSLAGAGKLYRDRERPTPLAPAAFAATPRPTTTKPAVRQVRRPAKRTKPAKAKARSHRARTTVRAPTNPTKATASRATTATHAPSTPGTATTAARPTAHSTSARAGGEFVLGGP